MEQLTIIYDGMEFTVWGYYTKGENYGSRIDPPELPSFDIQEVYKGDNDNIIEILTENTIEALNELAIESILNR